MNADETPAEADGDAAEGAQAVGNMLKKPMTRPRIAAGASSWTRVCAMALKDSSTKPAMNRNPKASG